MIRKIIQIDTDKCNGCGACANACHEGAIAMVNGKAKLMRDDYCDGFGDCLPGCPTGAITFEEREAAAYDEQAVLENKQKKAAAAAEKPVFHGCPGSAMRQFDRQQAAPAAAPAAAQPSQLAQWPCQIKLVPVNAPYFDGAKLLIAADCTAYAYANIHQEFMRGHVTLIGCPKLDEGDYAEKLTEILRRNDIRELTIVRPGIVYGKGEHGNMTRLYRGQKKGYFFYAGRKDTIKACIYVKELVRFFKYRMLDHSFPGAEIYNCTYEPAYTIEEICDAMQKATGLHRHVPLVPAGLLLFAAGILGPIGGKKVGIHPARVRKLMVSTNVCGRKLAATDYKFHYTLEESFRDWFEDCDRKELV